jgi:hypothetical protein
MENHIEIAKEDIRVIIASNYISGNIGMYVSSSIFPCG